MRKVIYSVANSLDNFIARPDGTVDWLFTDGTDYGMTDFFKSVDAMLMGRKTYELMLSHSQPRKSKAKSKKGKAKSSFGMGMTSYIFSRTMQTEPDDDVKIVSANAGEFVGNLKKEAGKNIWLIGGGELASSLLAAGVVDEISLNIHPVLLGAGIPLWPDIGKQLALELLTCKAHKNGCVQVTYRVKN